MIVKYVEAVDCQMVVLENIQLCSFTPFELQMSLRPRLLIHSCVRFCRNKWNLCKILRFPMKKMQIYGAAQTKVFWIEGNTDCSQTFD